MDHAARQEEAVLSSTAKHYDKQYFAWQASIGEFGGWANLTKFQRYVRPDHNVLDFGCGGGYLLKNTDCRGKMGIDISAHARDEARNNGIETHENVSGVPDGWADVIISNNALEHTTNPLQELRALHPKLKPGGRIVFVVPCESVSYEYQPGDVNHHLFSWSPMCLGNLFTDAGFVVKESKPYIHKWPRRYRTIARYGGRFWFELCCRIYGHLERSWFQVRVVAYKESAEVRAAA